MDKTADIVANGIFKNQGQTCLAPTRLFVQESVHEKMVEKLKHLADSRVVGNPFDPSSNSGAIISKGQFDKVLDYIKSGKEQGAKCVAGGERVGDKGFFLRPTIFVDVKDDMKIAREEVF